MLGALAPQLTLCSPPLIDSTNLKNKDRATNYNEEIDALCIKLNQFHQTKK